MLLAGQLSIWTRIRGIKLSDSERAIWNERTLAKAWCMRRSMFLDSEDRGLFVTEEEVEVAGDGTSATRRSVDECGKNPIHQGTVQRVSDFELKVKGKIIMGSRADSYEIRLVRRKEVRVGIEEERATGVPRKNR